MPCSIQRSPASLIIAAILFVSSLSLLIVTFPELGTSRDEALLEHIFFPQLAPCTDNTQGRLVLHHVPSGFRCTDRAASVSAT
jgi:hypothetical protein